VTQRLPEDFRIVVAVTPRVISLRAAPRQSKTEACKLRNAEALQWLSPSSCPPRLAVGEMSRASCPSSLETRHCSVPPLGISRGHARFLRMRQAPQLTPPPIRFAGIKTTSRGCGSLDDRYRQLGVPCTTYDYDLRRRPSRTGNCGCFVHRLADARLPATCRASSAERTLVFEAV